MNISRSQGLRSALVCCAALALVLLAMPRIAGTGWSGILDPLTRLGAGQVGLLVAVWLAGLLAHTPSLVAALPGLGHWRALQLNLTGSFVSNLLPLGGAGGTVVNWSMARSWGFDARAFTTWAILTNIADTSVKLLLPTLALCWLAISPPASSAALTTSAAVSVLLLAALAVLVWLVVRDERLARGIGAALGRLAHLARPAAGIGDLAERAAVIRRDCLSLGPGEWARLFGGKIAYAALQAVLLALTLRVVDAPTPLVLVLAAFAVERVLSMAVITPSGVGLVEAGMAATLIACGIPAGPAVAATLLYRSLVIGLEIPVGGLWFGAWALSRCRPAANFSAVRYGMVTAPGRSLR